jgi:hypothetical protein
MAEQAQPLTPEQQAVLSAKQAGPQFKFAGADPNTPEGAEQSGAQAMYKRLGEMYLAKNPGATYEQLQSSLVKMRQEETPEPEQPSALRGALIGLAAGSKGLDRYAEGIATRNSRARDKFEKIMDYREQATEGMIRQAIQDQNWAKAGKESLALKQLDDERKKEFSTFEMKEKMDLEDKKQKGRLALQEAKDKENMRRIKARIQGLVGTGGGKISMKMAEQIQRAADANYLRRAGMTTDDGQGGKVPMYDPAENYQMAQEEIQAGIDRAESLVGDRVPGAAGAGTGPPTGTFEAWRASRKPKK